MWYSCLRFSAHRSQTLSQRLKKRSLCIPRSKPVHEYVVLLRSGVQDEESLTPEFALAQFGDLRIRQTEGPLDRKAYRKRNCVVRQNYVGDTLNKSSEERPAAF